MEQTVSQRKSRWNRFMDPSGDERTIVLVDYITGGQRPWPYPQNRREQLEWIVSVYENQLEQLAWLDDDRVPAMFLYTGTEIFARALGSDVHYSGTNMPFALPYIHNAGELGKLKPVSVHESTLSEWFELARRLRQRAGEDVIFHLPDIQSPVDIAALVWEKADFLMTMLDDPPAVKEAVAITEALLTEFLDEWFKEFGHAYIAHYPSYYMEGGLTFSEDEIGEFSAGMFNEFCLEPINRLSDRFGGCGMHSCADTKHQWENFKKIHGLRLLNLVLPDALLDEVSALFGDTVCYWQMSRNGTQALPDRLPSWVTAAPPTAHVILTGIARTKEEARTVCGKLGALRDAR